MRSTPVNRQRLRTSVPPHGQSGWLLVLSLSLHLAALALLLMKPSVPPPAGASDPVPVEFITEKEPGQAPPEASRTTAPAPPEQPAQPAEASSPPIQPAEIPPAASVPSPEIVSTPQPAEIPLSAQAPAPTPAPTLAPAVSPPQPADLPTPPEPPSRPVPLARAPSSPPLPRPNRSPPRRITTVRPAPTRDVTGAGEGPVRAAEGSNSPGRPNAANNGAAWMGRLKQWWDQNSFYPGEASRTNEGGNVRVHITISGEGRVTAIELVQSSGSSVLDVAALAVFRNARLPPQPPGTPPQPADVVVTLHYRPSDGSR